MKSRDKQTPAVSATAPLHSRSPCSSKPAGSPPAGEPHSTVSLRQQAEAHFRESEELSPEKLDALSSESMRTILHELRVHQIELEMQNEELRRAQADLDTERARYFDLYDRAPVGYVTVSERGLILEANLTAATLLGVDRGALVKRPFFRFLFRVDQDLYYRYCKRLFETGEPQAGELRMVKKDGVVFWVQLAVTAAPDRDGTPVCRIVMSDITIRMQAEAALRESEERFARLAEQSGNFIWEVDTQGLYTYVSPVVEKVLGYRPDELIGRMHFYDLHPESGREAFKADAFAVFQRKDSFAGLVNAAQTKDGRVGWVITTGMPVLNADGSLRGYQGSDTDITARKQADEELQKLQKLQSVGTLAGGIAHDFNNILMGVFGNISLSKDELAKDHPSYTSLEEAEKSMSRAVRLTKQLLTFAKGGDPVKEDVSLGTLVEEVAHFDLSGSPVKLVYQQTDDLWLAEVDKGQIQQVVSNLVINARQAMPNGGCLYVTLENVTLPAGAIPGLRPGKYIRGTVRDEGTGIDPKNIDRIFDPYFTTKQTGNGLGLATIYSIINKHGGHIGVVSELGNGTTFTLYLPASEFPHAMETQPPAAPSLVLNRPARILVMDDEETVCRLVERMLTRCGFEVATAPGGQEAIAMYQQGMKDGAPFDVVIMDLTIPGGIGGKDAIKELLAIDPHAKAIVSSGYADSPVMANYADYGFKGVAAKPYTPNELRNVLARILK